MDSMKIVWSPFNASNTLRWVSDRVYCPCYTPHGGPVRTWGPDFLFKLPNVMSDFQLKKNLSWRFNERVPQRPTVLPQTDTHTIHADIVFGRIHLGSASTESAPLARQTGAYAPSQ